MKTKFKMLLSSMMVVVAIGFTSCEGDQGEIGPKGDQGTQGEKGTQGTQGVQGVQGAEGVDGQHGDSEAASFGNIELTVTGVDIHGDDFTEVVDFKYLPYNDLYNSMWYVDGDDNKRFSIRREFKVAAKTNGRGQDSGNNADFNLSVVDGELVLENFYFSATVIAGNSMLSLYDEVYSGNVEDRNFVITDYAYDEAKGTLKFNFTYSYTDYNDQPVTISGKVNVIVYEGQPA
jgi:hypothetical protein